jgi:hypothetical protein
VTATLGIWWARAAWSGADANDKTALVLQLVAWTALAGPFGTLIAAALMVPRVTAETGDADNQGFEVARLELLHGSLLDRRLRFEHAHPIRPLLDVIIDGTQVEKLDALSLISKRYAPALAPTLKRALGDKDASVRVLAATVMARQHNAYTKRIGTRQAIARAAPEDPNHLSELGQAHLDYAVSGLLETSRAEAETTQARVHLGRAEQLDPGHTVTQARLDAIGRVVPSRGQPTDGAHNLPADREYRVTPHGH